MSHGTLALTLALALALSAPPAMAQDAGDVPTDAPTEVPTDEPAGEPADPTADVDSALPPSANEEVQIPDTEAQEHYRRGIQHFNVGEFPAAIAEFEQAYALTNAPAMLFNIAQAYRAMKDYDRAILYYKAYLARNPESADRAYIEARIRDVTEARARSPNMIVVAEEVRGPRPPAPVAVPRASHPGAGRDGGSRQQLVGMVAAGTGAAMLLTAIYFAHEAAAADAEIAGLFSGGATWNEHFAEVYDRGERASTSAVILAGAGVAAVAGGAVLYYLGWREQRTRPGVALVPTTPTSSTPTVDGVALTITCVF